jgi:hypothetical protein
MLSGGPRLGQIEPRERSGAQTGRKYEYQYERTARATLDLLADGAQHVCVYCDWHDDYVAEIGNPPTRYVGEIASTITQFFDKRFMIFRASLNSQESQS